MPSERPTSNEPQQSMLRELSELRNFAGPPKEFWPRYLNCLSGLTSASKVVVLVHDPTQPGAWKRVAEWPANLAPSRFLQAFHVQIEDLAARCVNKGGCLLAPLEPAASRSAGHYVAASRLRLYCVAEASVAALLLSEVNEAAARESLLRLSLAADVPESYQINQAVRQARSDVEKLALALDLMVALNAEKRFLATALALCNGLSTSFRCQRVSLGWLEGGYIRLRAISRTEKFDRKMVAVVALETTMEEALDQDEEILWPAPEGATVVTRDHEKFSKDHSAGHVCSLPLRVDGKVVAVVTCERQEQAFNPTEVEQLRLCCDQATRRLSDLHRHDRWFGARLAAWWKERFSVIIGPKHTWAKVTALLIAILLAALFFVRVPYRVEGNFVLKSDDVSFRTAPFDGYIGQVFVRPGDTVATGDKLLKLMTRELELEESAALADLGRYQRESEKARATNGIAEMRVALALAEQSKARLDLVRHRLGEATLNAPFDGVVVEGDLRERLAAPVKQGDPLLKIARVENLYVEAEVHERDVHEILNKQRGEIAFVSQPKLKFPIRIVKLEPAAFPRTEGNVFLVRCEFEKGIEKWWRPGMSGLCKLGVEHRTLWWILTHRTVDFLRMKLWW
jgi:Barrel-sandwich domain of CusB or HlyD membrane-fusion/GAF domain